MVTTKDIAISQKYEPQLIYIDGKRVLTWRQFSEAYGVKRSFIFEQLKSRKLRAIRLGRRIGILVEDAEAWRAALPQY